MRKVGRGPVVGCVLGGAMVAAPFLALLYGVEAGLAVMAVALGATAWGAAQVARGAVAPVRRRLVLAAVVNGALALGCAGALVARLM